ncbi:MAG: hypothetical protein M3Y69_06200 [Verrucomicrobiota bacterium]|nr:hypothetical protein [Verrucomicrobiota bacterium]
MKNATLTKAAREITPVRRLARRVFLAFLLTFIAARVLVILIMTRRMPDLFFHAGSTHVHHLNYGIFILSAVGAVLVFVTEPSDRLRKLCALLYGFGMALTFDEFGMWLHLGGSYWQRGSFDAVIVLLSVFGWLAFMPKWERMRSRHWTVSAFAALAVIAFYFLLFTSAKTIGDRLGPRLQDIESSGPQ